MVEEVSRRGRSTKQNTYENIMIKHIITYTELKKLITTLGPSVRELIVRELCLACVHGPGSIISDSKKYNYSSVLWMNSTQNQCKILYLNPIQQLIGNHALRKMS